MLENLLRKVGINKSLALISVLAVVLSVLLDWVLSIPLGRFSFKGLVIAAVIPAIITPFIGYLYFKMMIRLQDSERMVKQSLAEKEVLLKELHHRVKNNLAIMCSLVNLQTEEVRDGYDREVFNDLKMRIYSMALVHEDLYRCADMNRVRFSDYAETLSKGVIRALSKNPENISFDITGRDELLDVGVLIPLGLIMNELITNSIKHAFPGGGRGKIDIHLSRANGNYRLRLGDDGVGAVEEANLLNAETLGLTLVQTLVWQLKGAIEVDTTAGTRYTLEFPCR